MLASGNLRESKKRGEDIQKLLPMQLHGVAVDALTTCRHKHFTPSQTRKFVYRSMRTYGGHLVSRKRLFKNNISMAFIYVRHNYPPRSGNSIQT